MTMKYFQQIAHCNLRNIGELEKIRVRRTYKHTYRLVQAHRPKFIKHPMSTPYFEDGPWNLAHVSYELLSTRYPFFFSPPDIFFQWPKIQGGGTQFVNGLTGFMEHMYNLDQSAKNGADIWTFERETCVICAATLNLVGFSMGSNFGVKRHVILALRSHMFECLR